MHVSYISSASPFVQRQRSQLSPGIRRKLLVFTGLTIDTIEHPFRVSISIPGNPVSYAFKILCNCIIGICDYNIFAKRKPCSSVIKSRIVRISKLSSRSREGSIRRKGWDACKTTAKMDSDRRGSLRSDGIRRASDSLLVLHLPSIARGGSRGKILTLTGLRTVSRDHVLALAIAINSRLGTLVLVTSS